MRSRWSSTIGGLVTVGGLALVAATMAQDDARTIRAPHGSLGSRDAAVRADEHHVETPSTSVQTPNMKIRAPENPIASRNLQLNFRSRPLERSVDLPSDVLFDFGEAKLTREGTRRVRQAANIIRGGAPRGVVIIEGHTDCHGSPVHNVELSLRRALAVRRELQRQLGKLTPSLSVEPFGESRPKARNTRPDGSDDPEGREANRRVKLRLAGAPSPHADPTAADLHRRRRCANDG